MSPGVSCITGVATMSRRTPRCSAASRENARAIAPKASQSVRASHGGGTAWLNECTNGCMSVIDRSYFSYQVAAGSTTSEYSPVVVIRKSTLTSRSSFPRGISSVQRTVAGRSPGGSGSASGPSWDAPSRWRMKYSWPLPDEPSRFERQTKKTRGWLDGALGSSTAKPRRPALSSETTCSAASAPAACASSARSSGLRSNVGSPGIHPIRTALAWASMADLPCEQPASRAATRSAPAAGGRSATARCACSTRTCPAPAAAAGSSRGRRRSSASRRTCGSSPARRSAPSRRRSCRRSRTAAAGR